MVNSKLHIYLIYNYLIKNLGDVLSSGKDRVFATFYVLLGAGIVGTIFGILSSDVMDQQENVLKNKITQAAVKMNQISKKMSMKIKEFREGKIHSIVEDRYAMY